jgi:hypothetical protein
MDFKAAVDYILSFADYERMPRSAVVFDLRRMERLLVRLGKPQMRPGRSISPARKEKAAPRPCSPPY